MRARGGMAPCLMVGLLFLTLLSVGLQAKEPLKTPLPLCEGNNLIQDMRGRAPEAYAQLKALADQEINSNALFWRITGRGVPPSFLFGTYHSTDPRITKMPLESKAALSGAKTVLVEIANLDKAVLQGVIKKRQDLFFIKKGPKLNSLLSADDYRVVLDQATKAGTPASVVPLLRPWFVNISFFAVPLCETTRVAYNFAVLDEQIARYARDNKQQLIGLETPAEQYEAFAAVPLADQVTLLEDGIQNLDRITDFYVTAREIYLSRQLGVLMPMSLFFARDQIKTRSALASFREHLIVKRNHRMLERSLRYLLEGNAFVAVGALHLTGQEGLVALLRQSGFKVEKVF